MIPIIGFVGKIGSGKSTAAKYVSIKYGYAWINVGDAIKDMLRPLGLSERELTGDLKEVPCENLGGVTPRYAMQTLGCEWRDLIDPKLFMRVWEKRVDAAQCLGGKNIVADGMRYEVEIEALKRKGGKLILIERDGIEDLSGGHKADAVSLTPDLTIINNGSITEFYSALDYTLFGYEP